MSNKKQPYINIVPPIELGPAPPRYQPPPQVLKTAVTNKTKNYPPSQQPIPVEPPTGQDVKFYPGQVKTGKQHFLPPQYSNPPGAVIQPPAIQRQSSAAIGLPRRAQEEDPRLNNADMLKFVRKAQDSETVLAESTRRIQPVSSETRALKEANQRLSDDNQELRDLCCFLDDDRQKGRKLAREWQRFGRYTASVMRQEVSAYQSKLRELDNKQQDLIKDNLELKELCLYLDEERSQNVSACPCGFRPGPRDDGDGGSSSSTNADEPALPVHVGPNCLMEENLRRQRTVFNDEMMEYVRGLELRVKQLEEDNRLLQLQLDQTHPSTMAGCDLGSHSTTQMAAGVGGRPEAVVQALQVLEVREQLERGPDADRKCPTARLLPGPTSGPAAGPAAVAATRLLPPDLDDGEKALVREMCNVVWRKLEEGPTPRR